MSVGFERGLPLPKFSLTGPTASPIARENPGLGFGERMGSALAKVEESATIADQAANDLVLGKIDLHEAMVKMEKADLMLKLGTTVRTKLVDAYQKLMASGAS